MAAQVGSGVKVDSAHLKLTLDELRDLAPDIRKELLGELRGIAKEIRDSAARRIHKRTGATARSYKVRVSPRAGVRIVGTTVGAAISEFAAKPKSVQGASLVRTLNAAYGKPGRLLWHAADERKEEIDRRVTEAVQRAEDAVNVRMHRI